MSDFKKEMPIDTGAIGGSDDRLKKLSAIKEEKARQELYSRSSKKYGEKRWEDAWFPYYKISTATGVVGSLLSAVIGLFGCIYVGTSLLGTGIGLIVGIALALCIEVAKYYFVKYGAENLFAGRMMSGGIQLCIGVAVIFVSVYTSYQSAIRSETFREFVRAEAKTGEVGNLVTADEIKAKIAKEEAILQDIATARGEWRARNKTQSANWLRAEEEINANKNIAEYKAQLESKTAEAQKSAAIAAENAVAAGLLWWVYILLLFPEVLIMAGYIFSEYYEWRVFELGIVEGRKVNREGLRISNSAKGYTAQTNSDDISDEAKALLKAFAEERAKWMERENGAHSSPTFPGERKIVGFGRSNVPVATDNIGVATEEISVATGGEDANYKNMDSDMLLEAYRGVRSKMAVWQTRHTDIAREQLKKCSEKIRIIEEELYSRGLVIKKVNGAYKLNDLSVQ